MAMTIPIKPLEYKVLIEVATVEEQTSGGIILPDSVRDKQQVAREVGTLVAVSAMAFEDPDWPVKPQVGDSVIYNRYAGSVIRHDHKEYRLMQDKDLGAIVTKEFSEEIK
jgi:chaperonin GroES